MRSLLIIAAFLLAGQSAGADGFDDLKVLLGGKNGKIVAHDQTDGNKIYLFDTADRSFAKLSEDIECYQPLISPDGTRVVYDRGGKVNIRPLDGSAAAQIVDGYDGHWWVDDNDDEWIYYTTIGDFPDDTARKVWYPNNGKGIQTHRIRLRDNLDEFVFDWKCSAGPSRDGTHLGAAYSTMIIFEVATGTAYVVNGGNQGCNGSMSPDNRYYLMHLELPHTTFCYRDRDDNRVWYIDCPAGTEEWQNPEFSTHPDFATATAKEDSGRYSVWVVKISTKEMIKVLDVADGSNWEEPHLWVEGSGSIECLDGETRNCGRDEGACEFGSQECLGGQWGGCQGGVPPALEDCQDTLDNDCDGLTDLEDVEDCGDGEDGGLGPDADAGAGGDDAGGDDAGTGNDQAGADAGADEGPGDTGGDGPSGGCACGGNQPVAPGLILLVALALLRRRK
jgi:uncharacterized protein (TIGR03382 family)